jgi:hypothetical protein
VYVNPSFAINLPPGNYTLMTEASFFNPTTSPVANDCEYVAQGTGNTVDNGEAGFVRHPRQTLPPGNSAEDPSGEIVTTIGIARITSQTASNPNVELRCTWTSFAGSVLTIATSVGTVNAG